jgi:hypothetical protein
LLIAVENIFLDFIAIFETGKKNFSQNSSTGYLAGFISSGSLALLKVDLGHFTWRLSRHREGFG